MTRNSFKRKAIIFGVMIFMSIALISTGFAAWIISTNTKENAGGNINVGVVTEKNIQILDIKLSAPSFEFEPLKDDNQGRLRWDGTHYEVLSTTVTAYVTNAQYLSELNITLDLSKAAGLKEAAKAKYINLPDCAKAAVNANALGTSYLEPLKEEDDFKFSTDKNYSALSPTEKAAAGDIMKLTYVITFTWGDTFGNVNPSKFYDLDAQANENNTDTYISDSTMKSQMLTFRKTMYGVADEQANNDNLPDLKFTVVLEAIAN